METTYLQTFSRLGALLVTDKNGMITWVCDDFCTLMSLESNVIKNKYIDEFCHIHFTNEEFLYQANLQKMKRITLYLTSHDKWEGILAYPAQNKFFKVIAINIAEKNEIVFIHISPYKATNNPTTTASSKSINIPSLFEFSPMPIQVFDNEGYICFANAAWENMMGTKLSIIEKDYCILKDMQIARAKQQHLVKRAFEGETVQIPTSKYHIKTSAGRKLIWAKTTLYSIKNELGKVIYVVAFQEDMTPMVELEQQIQKITQTLEHTQEFARLGSWYVDYDLNKVYWDKQNYSLFGLEKQENAPNESEINANLIHPEDMVEISKKVQESINAKGNYEMEIRQKQPDGSYKWVLTRGRPIYTKRGRLCGFSGVSIDINDKKISELKLIENEMKLVSINNNLSHVAIYQVCIDVRQKYFFQYASKNIVDLLGISAEDLQNDFRLMYDNVHHEDLKYLQREERRSFEDFKVFEFETRYYKPSDKEKINMRWLHFRSVPQRKENGDTLYVGACTDITERKKAENNLRDILSEQENLNIILAKREEQLAHNEEELTQINENLSNLNNELTKTNSELDRFVYSASHDLRAPISSMLGLLNLCTYTENIAELREYLALLEKSVRRLDKFIQDILDYSRNTRIETKREEINFRKMFEEIFEHHSYMENAKKIEKVIHIERKNAFFSDMSRLSIIFNNLISNAIRYADHTKKNSYIEVTILIEKTTTSIEIKDNGLGIEQEHLPRIYEMFYRGNEQLNGSGLGLYIVKETVDKLGGTINIASKVTAGTTINIVIPNLV